MPLPWLAGLAAAALLALGVQQYRGTEQASRALQAQLGASLQAAAERFAKDFDRELSRVVLYFQSPPVPASSLEAALADRYRRWADTAPFPGLVRGLFLVRATESGTIQVRVLDAEAERFVPGRCPDELTALSRQAEALTAWSDERRGPPPDPEWDAIPLEPDAPAVVLPLFSSRRGRHRGPPPEHPAPAGGLAVVWLDLPTITGELFPELARRSFAREELAGYRLTVLRDGPSRRLIYDSRPADEGRIPASHDAASELFRLLPPQEFRSLELELGVHLWSGQDEAEAHPPFPARRRREGPGGLALRFAAEAAPGLWRVLVAHPEGSLEAVASRVRRQSLLVSLGTLALLGLSLSLILLSARRTQQLARQQLEFVAGVTHELLTPLAALRSAGQNLADGVVQDPDRIRRYGALIDGEGRRLSEAVGQVLDFAGMQAQPGLRAVEPASVKGLVEEALEDSKPLLAESGFEAEVHVPEDLPQVPADRAALRKALRNLVVNALKYAAEGRWVGIRADATDGRRGPEVRIRVQDRGPGIAAQDLPHLFEPFYRGRGLAASSVPGSGLGLALVRHIVEAHGGRVSVETAEGRGSTFTIHLPAVAGAGRD
jgi:signal transduction histidine kinase